MKPTYDALLDEVVLHEHGAGVFPADGGVLTGDLEFPATGYIINSDTKKWRVTMGDDGAFVITDISSNAGKPIGLLLALTYTN